MGRERCEVRRKKTSKKKKNTGDNRLTGNNKYVIRCYKPLIFAGCFNLLIILIDSFVLKDTATISISENDAVRLWIDSVIERECVDEEVFLEDYEDDYEDDYKEAYEGECEDYPKDYNRIRTAVIG